MSKPILHTPPLTDEDAEALLDSLERIATPEEIARRHEADRAFLASVMPSTFEPAKSKPSPR